MIRNVLLTLVLSGVFSSTVAVEEGDPQFHDDYYAGFAQGFYYGLLSSGEDYEFAWCMKSELGHEAKSLGAGEEFQKGIDELLAYCRTGSKTE